MPKTQSGSAQPGVSTKEGRRWRRAPRRGRGSNRARWQTQGPGSRRVQGLLGLSALTLALTLTGCASTAATPVGAGAPLTATTAADTSQPTTTDLSSPSQAAPTSAAPSTAAPATSAAPKPKFVVPATTKASLSLCGAPSNPFGYNFCGRGSHITSYAATVCSYFNCIDNFQNGNGYMVECKDYTYSMSGGIRGACSYHKGVLRAVYSG